jgi:four helix bundle protein
MNEELKILQKTYDMIKYGYICLRQFPKSEKHTFAAEIKRSMLSMLRLLIQANRKYYKKMTIQELDVELDTLRYYARLAKDMNFLPFKKYENWMMMLNEIGRMIGGWQKSIKQ